MKILLIGRGKMGKLIESTAAATGDQVVASFDHENIGELASLGRVADVVMDFSRPAAFSMACAYVRRTGTPFLSGTTGLLDEHQKELIDTSAAAPVLWSANFSLGIAALVHALSLIAPILVNDYNVEITETHHNQKADAPSGTAKLLLNAVDPKCAFAPVYGRQGDVGKRPQNEIGIHSLRGGTVAGTHTVHFFGPDEELEFTHRATSRQIFVNGALHMARLLLGRPNGIYDLQNILFGLQKKER